MSEISTTVLSSYEKTAKSVIIQLKHHNIEGYWAPTAKDAITLVQSWMTAGDSVTWGGSETFKQSGMFSALNETGSFNMLDRSTATTPEEQREMWRDRTTANWFFMSANALTITGELVNIDGNSDRCSLLLHGPEHVVVLCGMNKLVKDVDAGIKRVRTIACPLNAERLHTQTPCDINGVCKECHAPACMCCNIVVTRHNRQTGRIKVVLIGEQLGY